MVLFVGEMSEDTVFFVWSLFFVKGSYVIFRVALTILQMMSADLMAAEKFTDAITVITTFC